MLQLDLQSLLAGGLIGLSLFLGLIAILVKRREVQRIRNPDQRAKMGKWMPTQIVKDTFGQAGIELNNTYLLIVYVVSFGASFLVMQVAKVLLPSQADIPFLILFTLILPILVGKGIAAYQRIAFREGLIQWMFDAASQAEVEPNLYRLTAKVMMTTRNKHTKRELQILLTKSHSENQPLTEVMYQRYLLWNMPTYRLIAVFSKVLVEAGGSVREGYLFIRDTLERQKMRELRINKKTRANRIGSYVLIFLFLISLIASYHAVQPMLQQDLLMKIWYYSMYVSCFGVLGWLIWYTRRIPK